MLILEIALGVVLGIILLWLMSYKAFWQFLGGCIGLILLLILYANRNTEFMQSAVNVVGVIFYGLFGILIMFLLWYNRKKIPDYIKNTPIRMKKWLISEHEKWKEMNIIMKIFSFIGLLMCGGLFIMIILALLRS